MALSNRERIDTALEQLRAGLTPFAEREFQARLGGHWFEQIAERSGLKKNKKGQVTWDTQALLKAVGDNWQGVFASVLGHVERAYLGELREVRNRWAHEEPFTSEDTERALDTMKRLLEAVSAAGPAEEVGKLRLDLQRTVFAEQARNKTRYQLTMEGMPSPGLKPWREVVTPHRDVASGRYAQAEFAADLAQVARGEGSDEYRDPKEFFRRTFLTAGLRDLLSDALLRLDGKGGEPVVELQTNFGGGKTHSMLALFHLFGGAAAGDLAGIDDLLKSTGVKAPARAHRAVLVGTDLSPAEAHTKPDGIVVRTMWGELAWQLGKAEGYKLVAESDARGVSPGGKVFIELFRKFSPCLVLIDEWVAYARQVVGKRDLPSGDFESQTSFAQAITEAAKAVDGAMVVASIPASKIEIGGENGELALETLKNVFERLGKPWRPASGDEGFEIVRRRLFEPLSGKDAFAHRDATVNAFARMYKEAPGDFPAGSADEAYKRELEAAYPIHPELFRRLYEDWSTLDKFQRTRGVLRLLAKVIHRLWEAGDGNLLILPGFIPMDDGAVKSELTRYLPDVWEPIISQDVDGEASLPIDIDRSAPNLGRLSAARRVTRTLYLGTAPGSENKNPGIDDRKVRLGCAQPGETVNAFGDALRRVSERARYIHQDGNRYWISTKANLNRLAEDRAASLLRDPEELYPEIVKRLQSEARQRGDFSGVHPAPESVADVPDEPEARLVILGPKYPHKKGQASSAALVFANEVLTGRGGGPRLEQNCLVFLAPDKKELDPLLDAVAHFLAWSSIYKEKERLNLDEFHKNQALTKQQDFDKTIDLRVRGTWIHALVPWQPNATAKFEWEDLKVTGDDSLARRTSAKLKSEEKLLPSMAGVRLRMELDRYLWQTRDHVSYGELCEWFARYLYLPRLKSRETLQQAIIDGASDHQLAENFAISAGWDEATGRYRALLAGKGRASLIEKSTLIVKPAAALRQLEKEGEDLKSKAGAESGPQPSTPTTSGPARASPSPAAVKPPNLFLGSVVLDGSRLGRDAGKIAEEVLQHLSTLPGAEVEVSLEIRVKVASGVKPDVVTVVTENARALKFTSHTFERE